MTTPGMQGEVSPESMGKMHHQPSEARPTRNPPLPQLLGNTAEQSRLKACTGKPFELSNELELESQKGNPALSGAWPKPSDTNVKFRRYLLEHWMQRFRGASLGRGTSIGEPEI
jgi:hypothetical protein